MSDLPILNREEMLCDEIEKLEDRLTEANAKNTMLQEAILKWWNGGGYEEADNDLGQVAVALEGDKK